MNRARTLVYTPASPPAASRADRTYILVVPVKRCSIFKRPFRESIYGLAEIRTHILADNPRITNSPGHAFLPITLIY